MAANSDEEDRKPFSNSQPDDDRKPPALFPADLRTRSSNKELRQRESVSDWSVRSTPSHWRPPHASTSPGCSRAVLWLNPTPAQLQARHFSPARWVWPRASAYCDAPPRAAPTDWTACHAVAPHWLSPFAATSGWLPPDDSLSFPPTASSQKGRPEA